ncbi:MAG TPA: YdcH family protein [Terriglobales bacterium]|jgi:uncharacterized protein YdcH (DUF465 family)
MADSAREQLLASDEQYRTLANEHAAYEQRLASLLSKSHPSDDDHIEEIRIKKLKLRLKDEMESIERRSRGSLTAA